jgi:hypothetical protein
MPRTQTPTLKPSVCWIAFVDQVQAGHRLVIGGQRARQVAGVPQRVAQDRREHRA